MKQISKIMAAVAAMTLCTLSFTACGNIDISDIEGKWTVSTIDGVSPAKYAEKFQVNGSRAAQNLTITEDSIIIEDVRGSSEYVVMARTNGFQAAENGKAVQGYIYDEDSNELSTTTNFGKGAVKVVFKKGTTDIEKLLEEERASDETKEQEETEEE